MPYKDHSVDTTPVAPPSVALVTKTYPDPESFFSAFNFFAACPTEHSPKILKGDQENLVIQYERVEGHHPKTQDDIKLVQEAYEAIHGTSDAPRESVALEQLMDYFTYVSRVADPMFARVLGKVGKTFATHPFTKANLVHGDMTCENIIISGNRAVFIDPGNPRGLYCAELDYAKLWQSTYTRWECIKREDGYVPPFMEPDEFLPHQTLALLATHWIRIHKNADRLHNWKIKMIAANTVFALGEML